MVHDGFLLARQFQYRPVADATQQTAMLAVWDVYLRPIDHRNRLLQRKIHRGDHGFNLKERDP
jgi:hypothetical protein